MTKRTIGRVAPDCVLVTGAVTVAADQLTKFGAPLAAPLSGALGSSRNPDLALGIAGGPRVVLAALMLVALAAAAGYGVEQVARGRISPLATGLALGGALSNAVDRVLLGSVRDVLTVADRYIVNLADVAILVGVAIIACQRLGLVAAGSRICRRKPSPGPR